MAGQDFSRIVASVAADIEDGADVAALRSIRDLFDDRAFIPAIKDYLAERDSSIEGVQVINALTRVMRDAEERRDRVDWHKTVATNSALGGGASMIVASVIASLSPTIDLFAVGPLLAGLFIGTTAYVGAGLMERERSLYRQLAERLAVIARELG